MWTTTGKPPADGRIWSTDNICVAARECVVIWYRAPKLSSLTVDDFNAFYGTELVENESIFICSTPIISKSSDGRRLDLIWNGEVVSRVTWNYGLGHGAMAQPGRAYRYLFKSDITVSGMLYEMVDAVPGVIDSKQTVRRIIVEPSRKERKAERKQIKRDILTIMLLDIGKHAEGELPTRIGAKTAGDLTIKLRKQNVKQSDGGKTGRAAAKEPLG